VGWKFLLLLDLALLFPFPLAGDDQAPRFGDDVQLLFREAGHLRTRHQGLPGLIQFEVDGPRQFRLGLEEILELTLKQERPLLQKLEGAASDAVKELLDMLRE
jgi:hypothetical protein